MVVSILSGGPCQPAVPGQRAEQELVTAGRPRQGVSLPPAPRVKGTAGSAARLRPFSGRGMRAQSWAVTCPRSFSQTQLSRHRPGLELWLWVELSRVISGLAVPSRRLQLPGWGLQGTLHQPHWRMARRCWARHLHGHAWPPPPGLLSCPLTSHQEKAKGLRAGADSEPQ